MSEIENVLPVENSIYAGFWRRTIAFIIDYNIILLLGLTYVVIADSIGAGNYKIDSPFGIWKNETVLDQKYREEELDDGSIVKYETTITKHTHFNKWEYTYIEEKTIIGNETETDSHELIDGSKSDLERTDKDDIAFILLFLYWIAFEASKLQATPGKILLGIKVVDLQGNRKQFAGIIGRNFAKILSLFTCFIGFFMAGWTRRKQALHDSVADCYVVKVKAQLLSTSSDKNTGAGIPSKSILLILAIILIGIPLIGILSAIMLPMFVQ